MNSINLDLACICDNAHMAQGDKLNIIGIFEKIFSKKFPFTDPQISFASSFIIHTDKKEFDFKFQVQILEQGKSEPLQKFENICKIKRKGENPNQRSNIIMNFQNVKFNNPGNYYVEVYLNEELVKVCNFKVIKI